MKSNLAFMLLGALASTAAAHKGYDALQNAWAAWENAATDFQGVLDSYADDAICEFYSEHLNFPHKFHGVNQLGKNGYSVQAYMGWLGEEYNFLAPIKHEDFAFPNDESRASSHFWVWTQHKTTGERLETEWFTEYTFNEKGQMKHIVQTLMRIEKIDAASIYAKAIVGYNVGDTSYWASKLTGETMFVLDDNNFPEYATLAGTYTFFEYVGKQAKLYEHPTGVDGGYLVGGNIFTSSSDGKTAYFEQTAPQVRKSDGATFFVKITGIITVTDKGKVAGLKMVVKDVDFHGSGAAHTEL